MRNHTPFYCLIPGSFRPPHQGHYEMIDYYRDIAKKYNGKVIVIVSNPSEKKERKTASGKVITAEYAKEKIEERFSDVEVRISTQSPVKDCYKFGNLLENGVVMFGCSNKDKDVSRFEEIKNFYKKYHPHVEVEVKPFVMKTQISAREIRELL